MNNYILKINPTPDKTGDTNITINATADNKISNSIIKKFSIIPTYNTGISSYDELIEGGIIPNVGQGIISSNFVKPFKFSEDGVLTISGMDGVNNFNGVYTPEPGKWRNPNLEPIRYTGDNGITFILRYVKDEIYYGIRCNIYHWDIQVINNIPWYTRVVDSFSGMHLCLLTNKSLEWGKSFNTDYKLRPARPINSEVYYTQEIKDNQTDNSWTVFLNIIELSDTFEPIDSGKMLDLQLTEEQESWGINVKLIYYGMVIMNIPDMTVIPKGIHEFQVVYSSQKMYKIVLHKEV